MATKLIEAAKARRAALREVKRTVATTPSTGIQAVVAPKKPVSAVATKTAAAGIVAARKRRAAAVTSAESKKVQTGVISKAKRGILGMPSFGADGGRQKRKMKGGKVVGRVGRGAGGGGGRGGGRGPGTGAASRGETEAPGGGRGAGGGRGQSPTGDDENGTPF